MRSLTNEPHLWDVKKLDGISEWKLKTQFENIFIKQIFDTKKMKDGAYKNA